MLSTFVTNFWLFLISYGMMSGIGCGLNYMIPVCCGWEYYPEKKGLITGIIFSAYGLGSFFYSLISTALVNPEGISPKVPSDSNLPFFDEEIAMRVPFMIRILCIVFSC